MGTAPGSNRSSVPSVAVPDASDQVLGPRVRVLPNLCHEPSLRAVSRFLPTASLGGLTPTGNPRSPSPRDNLPGCHI